MGGNLGLRDSLPQRHGDLARLGPIATGHAEQAGAVGDRLAGQRRHVYWAGAFEQCDLGMLRLGTRARSHR